MKLATIKNFLLFFFIGLVSLVAQTPYELVELKNPPKKLVQDYAHIFDQKQLQQLENKLVAYNDSTSTQILVLTLESLDGYPLETFTNENKSRRNMKKTITESQLKGIIAESVKDRLKGLQ